MGRIFRLFHLLEDIPNMDTDTGVAIDQAAPGAPAIDPKGQPVEKKWAMTAEEIRLLARESAEYGHRAHATRLSQLLGEAPPHIGFFAKRATRGEVVGIVGGVMVGAAALTLAAKEIFQRFKAKRTPSSGKVVRLPNAASH